MDAEVTCAGRVEVVHGYDILVIVGSCYRLVRKVRTVRHGVQVEGPRWVVTG
jgi:hypothetical protein